MANNKKDKKASIRVDASKERRNTYIRTLQVPLYKEDNDRVTELKKHFQKQIKSTPITEAVIGRMAFENFHESTFGK